MEEGLNGGRTEWRKDWMEEGLDGGRTEYTCK